MNGYSHSARPHRPPSTHRSADAAHAPVAWWRGDDRPFFWKDIEKARHFVMCLFLSCLFASRAFPSRLSARSSSRWRRALLARALLARVFSRCSPSSSPSPTPPPAATPPLPSPPPPPPPTPPRAPRCALSGVAIRPRACGGCTTAVANAALAAVASAIATPSPASPIGRRRRRRRRRHHPLLPQLCLWRTRAALPRRLLVYPIHPSSLAHTFHSPQSTSLTSRTCVRTRRLCNRRIASSLALASAAAARRCARRW